jgi:mono/diheme cytochrome c family protein
VELTLLMMRNLLLAAWAAAALAAAPQYGDKQAPDAADANQALIKRYCATCHNQKLRTAKLALDVLDLTHPEKNALIWERAIRKLRGGMMPPPGAPRPPVEAVNALAAYLEASLDRAAATNPNPGCVRIHRLNRNEYANAMRDLFGVEVDAAALLPTDDISDGFDNIAGVLKVSPSFLDQYIMAARAVVRQAIGTPVTDNEAKTTLRGIDPNVPLPPGARSGITAEYVAPYEGDYELRATANPAVFTVDGTAVDTKGRTHLKAGPHAIVSAMAGHSLAESEGELFGFIPGAAGTGYASTGIVPGGSIVVSGGANNRVLGTIATVTVDGPFNPTLDPVDTLSRTLIFICRAPDPKQETPCASRILSKMARKAFRRPVTSEDLAPLMRFYNEGRKAGSFEAGIENAMVAMLASAKFLYRVEPPPAGASPGSLYRLSDTELASRLSFFLWSSIPDDELLAMAEQGKLRDPQVLEHQVRRMLADSRAKTLTTNFAFEWMKVRDMDTMEPDPYVHPAFDRALRTALRKEMELFVDSVFREDHSVVDLLSANYTFVNERLAAHYGIQNVRGDEFRRVTLADPSRFGLLGKGAVLMVTAYPNRTSPVLRGSYILENILGTPPSPPPPNVPPFKENKEGEKAKTVRAILEEHRANPTCNACHGVMDPLGFALENFDAIGTYRTMDRFTRTNIDTGGKLVDGTALNGPSDLREALLKRQSQFVQTFTEKLMTYALGRGVEYYDMPNVRKIVRDAAHDDHRFSSVVRGIVNAPEFQSSMVELTEQQPPGPKEVASR